jgi:hypothetical protein
LKPFICSNFETNTDRRSDKTAIVGVEWATIGRSQQSSEAFSRMAKTISIADLHSRRGENPLPGQNVGDRRDAARLDVARPPRRRHGPERTLRTTSA